MTWLAFIAAIRSRLSAITSRANTATEQTRAACGHAPNIGPSQRPAGQSISALIARRAQRRCNRDHRAASTYEARHTILARGLK